MNAPLPSLLLDASAIEKSFGPTSVLKKANLRVAGGEIHALLGGNGAGKSTLIRIVSGFLARDGGRILVAGRSEYDPGEIAVVHQELALLPHLSIAENVRLPRARRAFGLVSRGHMAAEASAALNEIDEDLAASDLDRPLAELDLHQRQFVEIARALSSGARLLLLDEPTANLTLAETERLFGILRRLAGRGISTLLVSHRMNEIRAVADVCTVLRDGRSVVDRISLADLTDRGIVEAMGQAASPDRGRPDRPARLDDRPLLGIAGDGISLALPRGSVLGLAGAPAGPAEMIDALIGAAPTKRWAFELDGRPVRFSSPAQALRRGVGYVSGDRAEKGILASLPILDNVAAAARVRTRRLLARRAEVDAVGRALGALSIKAASIDDLPRTLSGGTQQKLLLARWLELQPKLLVLEEPTRGVDIGTKREIYAIIRRAAAAGTAVVWWSTEFSELAEICDQVLAFDLRGRPSGILAGERVTEVDLARATEMAA